MFSFDGGEDFLSKSKKGSKDQESIRSSTTHDPEYYMGMPILCGEFVSMFGLVVHLFLVWQPKMKRDYIFVFQVRSQAEARKPGLQRHGHIHEKPRLFLIANNKGADQPAHPRSLISAFIICYLKSEVTRSDVS